MVRHAVVAGGLLLSAAGAAHAQLVAVDDFYVVPYAQQLVVEVPGVLANDTFNGEAAVDAGATVVLVTDVSYGTLNLVSDGSFTYNPGPTFGGADSFVYEAVVSVPPDTFTSQATVTLTACSGGPTQFVCWKEAPYLAKLGELGYRNFQEGFEDDAAWGAVREPNTALSVVSRGITWETNYPDPPASNEITTGTGPARTGLWGVYDPDHGYATGSATSCDVSPPLPDRCLYKDGFTGTRVSGESTLYGVGGYFTGSGDPNLVMILDGGTPIALGLVPVGDPQFFGVIDTAGFTSFRVEETDGKVGQLRLVFGDDFTFGTTPGDTTPPRVTLVDSVEGTVDGVLSENEVTNAAITQLVVTYSELVSDLGGETAPHSATNPANYLLFSDGGNGFDTIDCATGIDAGDSAVTVDSATSITGSELTVTLDINSSVALPEASYRLLVCGTTSIKDFAGNALDGDGNGTGGDDFARTFHVLNDPTPVMVSSFGASERGGAVVAEWRTLSEAGTIGFDLYRRNLEDGDYSRLNDSLLPALFASPAGGLYRFVDEGASPRERQTYLLVETTKGGMQRTYGPYEVAVDWSRRGAATSISGSFDRRAPELSARLASRLAAGRAERQAWRAARAQAPPAKQRRAWGRRGPAHDRLKIAITAPGLYFLSALEIADAVEVAAGDIEDRIRRQQIAIHSQQRTVAWRPAEDNLGLFFYGEPPESLFTRENVYWLEFSRGLRMDEADGAAPDPAIGPLSFRDSIHFEENILPATIYSVDPASDFWYWEILVGGDAQLGSRSFTLAIPAVAATLDPAALTLHLRGILSSGLPDEHHIVVSLNGVEVGESWFEGTDVRTLELPFEQGLLRQGDNTVEVTALLDGEAPSSFLFVDSFDLEYERHYRAEGGVLRWRGDDNPVVTVTGFETPEIAILELGDRLRPRWVTGLTVDQNDDGFRVSIEPGAPDVPLLAVAETSVKAPERIWADISSELRRPSQAADFLVIVPAELSEAARVLADYRRSGGLETLVVEVEDVYDEFNHGLASPHALRDFLSYAYSNWRRPPRFVVLAGAGSFDYRDYMGHGGNLVPPLLVETPDGLFASDTILGDVEGGDGVPEIAVGRLPVLTVSELEKVVAKIVSYETLSSGDWQHRIVLSADNGDRAGDYPSDSDQLMNLLGDGWAIDRIYLSELPVEEARPALIDELNGGVYLFNYLGHAAAEQLAHEGLLRIEDVASLTNSERLPLVAGWTCLMSRFELPDRMSVGEALLLHEGGGGVAVWGPTGLSFNDEAKRLNEAFFRSIFNAGEQMLGEAILDSLAEYAADGGDRHILTNYNLLGDPALWLRVP